MKTVQLFALVGSLILVSFRLEAVENLTFSAIGGSMNTLVSARVLKEAYKRINIEITINEYPGVRALQYSNDGKTDGELFRIGGIDKQYLNLKMISVPINKLEGMAFTKQVKFSVSGWESLKPYRVGIRRGIKFSEKGVKSVGGIDTHIVSKDEQLFKLLEAGRVDIVVNARLNGQQTSKQLSMPDITPLEPPIETYPLFHYLNKRHSDIIPKITSVLQEMENEGLIQKIREQFIAEKFSGNN